MTIANIGIVFALLLSNSCFGQTYWKRTYGFGGSDLPAAICPNSNGNYLVAGYKYGDFLLSIGSLMAIKPNGDTIWTKVVGTINSNLCSIQPAGDGNDLVAGYTMSNGEYHGWLVKIKPNGDTLWKKFYRESGYDFFYAMTLAGDGNFLIAGSSGDFGWLLKINPDGDILWTKTLTEQPLGYLFVIQSTYDNNFLVMGSSAGGWLIKIKSNGDTLWTKTFFSLIEDRFNSVQPTVEGSFLITGYNSSGTGVLLKINPYGKTIWRKTYNYTNAFYKIQAIDDGNYLIVGMNADYGCRFLKINSNGDTLWTKTCDGFYLTEYGTSIQRTAEGNFLIVGRSNDQIPGQYNAYILCLIADQYAYKDSLFTFKIPTYDVDSLNCGYSPIKVPSGMTVSTGGTVSWTPKTDSVYMDHAEYLVINDVGKKDTLSFNIFVNSDYHAPVIKMPSQIVKTTSKSFDIKATSLSGKVKFSLPSSASSLYIYDITGRMVDRIVPVISGSGTCAVWPGSASNSSKIHAGKYFAKALMGKNSAVKPFLFYR
jgi:hypothetical protein